MATLFKYVLYQPVKSTDFEDDESDKKHSQRWQRAILRRIELPELVALINLVLFGAFIIMAAKSVALATTSVTSLCTPEAVSTYCKLLFFLLGCAPALIP